MAESVAVVIPSGNRRLVLARALRSALQQEHVDVSVIVVDDGSGDHTAEFVAGDPDPPSASPPGASSWGDKGPPS